MFSATTNTTSNGGKKMQLERRQLIAIKLKFYRIRSDMEVGMQLKNLEFNPVSKK